MRAPLLTMPVPQKRLEQSLASRVVQKTLWIASQNCTPRPIRSNPQGAVIGDPQAEHAPRAPLHLSSACDSRPVRRAQKGRCLSHFSRQTIERADAGSQENV